MPTITTLVPATGLACSTPVHEAVQVLTSHRLLERGEDGLRTGPSG